MSYLGTGGSINPQTRVPTSAFYGSVTIGPTGPGVTGPQGKIGPTGPIGPVQSDWI
jgi:hypothetical protein